MRYSQWLKATTFTIALNNFSFAADTDIPLSHSFVQPPVQYCHASPLRRCEQFLRTLPHSPPLTESALDSLMPADGVTTYERVLENFIPETVLGIINGPDGRQRVDTTKAWPYRLHGEIAIKFGNRWGRGSGALVGPRHVLTAAHNICAHHIPDIIPNGTWAQAVEFLPALNGETIPFGKIDVTHAFIYKHWKERGEQNSDIALLLLKDPIGEKLGYYGIWSAENALLANAIVGITGYSGDDGKIGQLLRMSNFRESDSTRFPLLVSPERIYYQIDTSAGQSGSPVSINEASPEGVHPFIIAVHAYGDSNGSLRNSATRLTSDKFEWLVRLIEATGKIRSEETDGAATSTPHDPLLPLPAPAGSAEPEIQRVETFSEGSRLDEKQQIIYNFQAELVRTSFGLDNPQRKQAINDAITKAILAAVPSEKRDLLTQLLTSGLSAISGSLKDSTNKVFICNLALQGGEKAKFVAEVIINSLDD